MARELEQRRAAHDQKKARLQQEAARIAKAERAWQDRRKIIVGATVLNAMATDPELFARVRSLVKSAVTRDADKKHVADLLGLATPKDTPAPSDRLEPPTE